MLRNVTSALVIVVCAYNVVQPTRGQCCGAGSAATEAAEEAADPLQKSVQALNRSQGVYFVESSRAARAFAESMVKSQRAEGNLKAKIRNYLSAVTNADSLTFTG